MEADSTGTYHSTDDIKNSGSNSIDGLNVQSPKVQSSLISSCDEETFQKSQACSSSDVTEGSGNIHGDTDEIDVQSKDVCTESYFDDSHLALKNLNMETTELQESPNQSESRIESESTSHDDIVLTEKELEHIEDSVLSKYTGLNIDLASENQLLKEDVIKCRCELKKYGKKLALIERKLDRAYSYNDDLRVQVDKLSRELHEYRREKHKVFIHVDTQTSSEDIMEIEDDTLYDVNLPGLKPESDLTFDLAEEKNADGDTATKDSLQTPGMSIADSLKVTAEAAMNQTGFVYDEQSGLYYDYNTGYYYNAEKGLYYDPKSGTYFYYNKSTGKYEFHSQVDLSYYTPSPVSHSYSDRSHGSHRHSYSDKYPVRSPEHESSSGKKKKKKESRRRSSDEKVDAGYEEVLSAFSSLSVRPESTLKHAPCIRAMVTSSDLLDEGILFIVTVKGGMIGRENRPDLVICVPDINVSKVHAEIRYDSKQQIYTIQDKGSQNGTYVNEERISESKKVSKWIPLKHEDTLQLSCTRFEIHIHPGTDTCDKCEPGLVISKQPEKQTIATDAADIRTQHKQQLKSMKKKYGLQSLSYTDNTAAINNPKYQDKAKERRQTVGSDNPHKPDDFPSSLHRPIEETNKGHKLLKKMGWAEGESLGKDNAGIQEPINITVRVDRSAGLGAFGRSNEMSIGNIGVVNARRRFMQTQIRYTHTAENDKNKDKQFEPKMWVQGATQGHIESKNEEEVNKDI